MANKKHRVSRDSLKKTVRMTLSLHPVEAEKVDRLARLLSEKKLEVVEHAPLVRESAMREIDRQLAELETPAGSPA